MASSRPKLDPCQQKQLDPVDLAKQPATSSAQNATTTWAFSPARPSNFHFGRAPAATLAPPPPAHATAAAVRGLAARIDYEEKFAYELCRSATEKLQSEAKNAAMRVCHQEQQELVTTSHIG